MAGRLLTALVGIPLLVGAIWVGLPWLTILVGAAVFLGLREYHRMTSPAPSLVPFVLAATWGLGIVVSAQLTDLWNTYLPHAVLGAGVLLSVPWLLANFGREGALVKWGLWVFGPFYVAFLLAHALLIRELDGGSDLGRDWLLFGIIVVFATDTGAFFTGRLVGRHKMAPRISPGKTWEGAFGGMVWAVGIALLLGAILELQTSAWQAALVGVAAGIAAQLGDLLESRLKRASGVKDAGGLLPGHGGILDRADSIVLAIPAVYYLVKFTLDTSG